MGGSSSPDSSLREHRLPRRRRGHPPDSPPAPASAPDLAAVARAAVISFLRDESATTGERDAILTSEAASDAKAGGAAAPGIAGRGGTREADWAIAAAGETIPVNGPPAVGESAPHALALRAAALSVAALNRIEAAAAKLEADIAAARTEQAELQAGAGIAAEGAVRAAQAAWTAAGTAEEASSKAESSMRRIGRYMVATVVLVVIQVLFAVVFASSAH
jgi:hypothetical protein